MDGKVGNHSRNEKDFWIWDRVVELEDLRYSRCKGKTEDQAHRHKKPFLGVADIAGLLWCEAQATISQYQTQEGYIEAARQDDETGGQSVIVPNQGQRLSPNEDSLNLRGSAHERGKLAEERYAERYTRRRHHWDFGDFLVIGMPDGITQEFVYEFKYSNYPRSRYTFQHAIAQANIYATLFQKDCIRIHIVGPNRYEKTQEGDVRKTDAYSLIRDAWALYSGSASPRAPDPRRCRSCRYANFCPFPTNSRMPTIEEIQSIPV